MMLHSVWKNWPMAPRSDAGSIDSEYTIRFRWRDILKVMTITEVVEVGNK